MEKGRRLRSEGDFLVSPQTRRHSGLFDKTNTLILMKKELLF